MILHKAKDDLSRSIEIKRGVFVTFDDVESVVKPYIVSEVEDDKATIYGLTLTPEHDDVLALKITCDVKMLIGIDDSFVNYNGSLWRLREKILAGKPVNTREAVEL